MPSPRMIAPLFAVAVAALTAAGCQTAGTAARAGAPVAKHAVYPEVSLPEWLAGLRREALERGVRGEVFDQAFADVRLSDRVTELDSSQPEFSRQVWQYLDSAVSERRVADARARLERHGAALRKAADPYGVPAEIIVAFWGVETDFGASTGNFSVIDAVTTLAYRGRRTDYFRGELLAALQILNNGDIPLSGMRGSWAGAMGQTQFMPTIFLANAVDGDGDGRRDIWNSLPDVFASTAKFVRANGWRAGESWGQEVILPQDFPYQDAELTISKPVGEWRRLGVKGADGKPLVGEGPASVLLLAGHTGPAFLARENFRAIMRYNPSTSYALAVAFLSDRMTGKPGVAGAWPRHEPALSRDERTELQERLARLGHDPGKIDGIIGGATRTAVRKFQAAARVIPDGFVTKDLLEKLRRAGG
jgi:membrane-bound lytic murein transglycosylase B